ncbi:MAG: nitrogen regulation protein NR(II) [Parasulfuritortus sp.]|jgi:two-component system nitrogen regulation sensor histidine kinase GlnL|nr:nitrogen regulation protein NR(II) [Parasulfuritortus sp.]
MKDISPGLDILTTAVLIIDEERIIRHINPAAENLFGISAYHSLNRPLSTIIKERTDLVRALNTALREGISFTEHHIPIELGNETLTLNLSITPIEGEEGAVVLEFHSAGSSVKIARDEQAMAQAQTVQMLLKQLAHEIRNPLGGILGAAQLLEAELNGADLSEYTQVIIQETNRLQGLLDRWLTPAKRPEIRTVNVHEVLERVRNLLLAEFPSLEIQRDYDISVPEIQGDQEQLIQAVLNIARNAAQANNGEGTIKFATRISRQVTLSMKRWKLAARIDIIDYGPGIPEDMQGKIFFPLVSGRENGTGVGLTLAQSLVQRHEGVIHMVSEPGFTCFSIFIPVQGTAYPTSDS